MKIKTLDITVKEWFDKVNGNSYWSSRAIVNYGMKTEKTIVSQFDYGYGSHGENATWGNLKRIFKIEDNSPYPSMYCKENGIIYRYSKIKDCRKRDVVAFGKE